MPVLEASGSIVEHATTRGCQRELQLNPKSRMLIVGGL